MGIDPSEAQFHKFVEETSLWKWFDGLITPSNPHEDCKEGPPNGVQEGFRQISESKLRDCVSGHLRHQSKTLFFA